MDQNPAKTLGWITAALLLLPVAAYIPPVQTLLKNVAASVVKKSTGMEIGIEKFRIKSSLRRFAKRRNDNRKPPGDTMVRASELVSRHVKLIPFQRR